MEDETWEQVKEEQIEDQELELLDLRVQVGDLLRENNEKNERIEELSRDAIKKDQMIEQLKSVVAQQKRQIAFCRHEFGEVSRAATDLAEKLGDRSMPPPPAHQRPQQAKQAKLSEPNQPGQAKPWNPDRPEQAEAHRPNQAKPSKPDRPEQAKPSEPDQPGQAKPWNPDRPEQAEAHRPDQAKPFKPDRPEQAKPSEPDQPEQAKASKPDQPQQAEPPRDNMLSQPIIESTLVVVPDPVSPLRLRTRPDRHATASSPGLHPLACGRNEVRPQVAAGNTSRTAIYTALCLSS